MEGVTKLKKIIRVISIILCLIGVTSISVNQAVQPYKHLTYGDVVSAFEAFATGGFIVYSLDNIVAAPAEGREGFIQPWWPHTTLCVEDAHCICFYWIFNVEDHEMASEFYKMEVVDKLVITTFYINNIPYTIEFTALKPHLGIKDAQYGWWYGLGLLFKPEELSVGFYTLNTTIDIYVPPIGWIQFFHFYTTFEVVECWH